MKYLMFLILTATMSSNANVGTASWYGGKLHGNKTASGKIFNQYAMTTACYKGIKLGTKLKVTNVSNNKSVIVECTDRGGFHKARYGYRKLDLSKGAFSKIANVNQGVIKVKYEIID